MLSSYCLSSNSSQQIFKISSTWTNARKDASDHGLSNPFKGPGVTDKSLTHVYRKCYGEASLCFQLKLSTRIIISVPADKYLKDWCWANVGALPQKFNVWAHTDINSLSFVFMWVNPKICASILDTFCKFIMSSYKTNIFIASI